MHIFLLFFILTVAGCGTRDEPAPVAELRAHSFSKYQNRHIVRRGETLYAIAFGYDTDFRHLAYLNHLSPPYSLRVGQVLNVQGLSHRRAAKKSYKPYRAVSKAPVKPSAIYSAPVNRKSPAGWLWPVQGRVATTFIPYQGKKGINIACNKGEKVHASAAGVVAYAGSGLSGYGNLIIVKHNNQFLTAYGNNARNLVSEGQQVRAGQIIAEAGIIDRKYWGVHFEIRKIGVPVNPLNYLQRR